MSNEKVLASEIAVGETFVVGGIEWIKFPEKHGGFVAVAKESLGYKVFDNNSNDFSKSSLLKYLEKEILPEIINEVGEDKVLDFETDLFSLDGHKKYGKMTSRISLSTFDFYRENREIFNKHPLDDWWWLSTPNGEGWGVVVVAPSGVVIDDNCGYDFGVRPFCILKSDIFVS